MDLKNIKGDRYECGDLAEESLTQTSKNGTMKLKDIRTTQIIMHAFKIRSIQNQNYISSQQYEIELIKKQLNKQASF